MPRTRVPYTRALVGLTLPSLRPCDLTVFSARKNVWTVVAVLRALPPLARQLVMRLAFLDAPADVSPWVAAALKSQQGSCAAL